MTLFGRLSKVLVKNKSNVQIYRNAVNYGIAKSKNICIKLLENENIDLFCLLQYLFISYFIFLFTNLNYMSLFLNFSTELKIFIILTIIKI